MSEIWGKFIYEINSYQKILNTNIASSFKQVDEAGIYGSLTIIAIAFVYGIVHAAGPGHGKAIVASYFLSQGRRLISAFKMGYLVSTIHALSALILTFLIYYLVDGLFSRTFNQSVDIMYKVSGIFIIFVGLYLIYELKKEWNTYEKIEKTKDKKSYIVALSVGIVPCPGVMTVLFFSLMMGHFVTGILATIAMSIGMGLTISLTGALVIKSSHIAKNNSIIIKILQVLSPFLVLCIGVFLVL